MIVGHRLVQWLRAAESDWMGLLMLAFQILASLLSDINDTAAFDCHGN